MPLETFLCTEDRLATLDGHGVGTRVDSEWSQRSKTVAEDMSRDILFPAICQGRRLSTNVLQDLVQICECSRKKSAASYQMHRRPFLERLVGQMIGCGAFRLGFVFDPPRSSVVTVIDSSHHPLREFSCSSLRLKLSHHDPEPHCFLCLSGKRVIRTRGCYPCENDCYQPQILSLSSVRRTRRTCEAVSRPASLILGRISCSAPDINLPEITYPFPYSTRFNTLLQRLCTPLVFVF